MLIETKAIVCRVWVLEVIPILNLTVKVTTIAGGLKAQKVSNTEWLRLMYQELTKQWNNLR